MPYLYYILLIYFATLGLNFQTEKEKIRNFEDEYYTPISALDSRWEGISFELPPEKLPEHDSQGTTDAETEVRVFDLEKAEELPPILLLFPDLKNTSSDCKESEIQDLSPTDLTKLLIGKKPNMTLLKSSKRLQKPVSIFL